MTESLAGRIHKIRFRPTEAVDDKANYIRYALAGSYPEALRIAEPKKPDDGIKII